MLRNKRKKASSAIKEDVPLANSTSTPSSDVGSQTPASSNPSPIGQSNGLTLAQFDDADFAGATGDTLRINDTGPHAVQNSHRSPLGMFPDTTSFFQHVAKLFVALVPDKECGSVEITDILNFDPPSEPMPPSSTTDLYTRSMLKCLVGYHLPDSFSLGQQANCLTTRELSPLPHDTSFSSQTVIKSESGEYICKGSEGAILVLPEGALQQEAIDIKWFENTAKLCSMGWYKDTMTQGKIISNGSLYLVTSFTKCIQWGTAIFDRPCNPGRGLTFVNSPLSWKSFEPFKTKVADTNQGNIPNQCVFLRGYKIMIRQDIFDELRKLRSSQRIRGDGGISFMSIIKSILASKLALIRIKKSTVTKSDKANIDPNFNSSPVHPLDLINGALLSQNPEAKISLTHDDVWCDLLRDNFPELNQETLKSIARSYMSNTDEGCVSLEKITKLNTIFNRGDGVVQSKDELQTLTESGGIVTHVTIMGSNANLAGASAVAFGAYSTATYTTYNISLGDLELTEIKVEEFMAGVLALPNAVKKLASVRSKTNLPRAKAAYDDYKPQKEHHQCFDGTRDAILREIGKWFIVIEMSHIYVLSGLAGTGKSTIAYTVAQKASSLGFLGASFFFSRKEAERRTAEKFFTTIAFQLCVYDDEFAHAIKEVLATNQGEDAITKDPETQLNVLIIKPLQDLVQSRNKPIVIVVDALDECEDVDAQVILKALGQLVHEIPYFKVLLTARPQPHLNHLLSSHNVFYLHDVDDEIVNHDIQSYLKFKLSINQVESILPGLITPWCATDNDIDTLVRAADKLFIAASVSVLFILDKAVRNPASQMQMLRSELAQKHIPQAFNALYDFYSIIFRAVVPPRLVERFQKVVGTIALLYDPLPVQALAELVHVQEDDIYGVLHNFQSVILLGTDNIPYIYHHSFSDWIIQAGYCDDKEYGYSSYRIDRSNSDTWLTIRCLQTMNQRLKRNVLNFDTAALSITSSDAPEQVIMDEKKPEVSSIVRYACIHWTRHLVEANIEDPELINQLNTFVSEHWLHWIEALCCIASEFSFRIFFDGVLKFMKATNVTKLQGLRQLLSEGLRFINRFFPVFEGPALFTYQSALPFAPTQSIFYEKYRKEMEDNICQVQGGPKEWDSVITSSPRGQRIGHIAFLEHWGFAACSETRVSFWDFSAGTSIAIVDSDVIAIAKCFGIATGQRNTISILGLPNLSLFATVRVSTSILCIAFSPDGRRLAVALSDGSVALCAVDEACKSIAEFHGFESDGRSNHELCHFAFSSNGERLAYSLAGGGMALRNAVDGKHIDNLNYQSAMVYRFVFSPNGSHIACLVVEDHKYTLTLWECIFGKFIGAVQDVGSELAFSADGLLIATGGSHNGVKLWSRDNEDQGLCSIKAPQTNTENITCLAFSQDDMLAIGTTDTGIILYDVPNCSLITTITFRNPIAIAFSHDSSRLAAGNADGVFRLLDVPMIKASAKDSLELKDNLAPVSASVFSPDCSRLVSGSEDGVIRIWDTRCASKPIATRDDHSSRINLLAFTPSGGKFASGDASGTIILWHSEDGAFSETFQWPISEELTSITISNHLLAAATNNSIILWNIEKSCFIDRLGGCGSTHLSLSNDNENPLLASFDIRSNTVTVWDVKSLTLSATFNIPKVIKTKRIQFIRMVFYPDDSQLFFHLHGGGNQVYLFDIVNKTFPGNIPINEAIVQGIFPSWKGIPVVMCSRVNRYFIRGWFGRRDGSYIEETICQLPEDLDVCKIACGSSMFALLCRNGNLILLQSN